LVAWTPEWKAKAVHRLRSGHNRNHYKIIIIIIVIVIVIVIVIIRFTQLGTASLFLSPVLFVFRATPSTATGLPHSRGF
jgi:cell division protein FtsW (lipid II flippase)